MEKFFVVDSVKSGTAIFEVLVRDVSALEQPSVNWILGPGERLLRIVEGPPKMVGAKFFSFFCFKTVEEAMVSAKKEIKIDMERVCLASGTKFDDRLFEEKCSQISYVPLN